MAYPGYASRPAFAPAGSYGPVAMMTAGSFTSPRMAPLETATFGSPPPGSSMPPHGYGYFSPAGYGAKALPAYDPSRSPSMGSRGPVAPPMDGSAPGVAGTSYKVPRGAKYLGAQREERDGKEIIIDRYAVPQRHVQQVEKLIEETKQVTVMETRTVPETKTIQVPMTRMVPQQHTVMVPRVKMVPVREMVPQVVTKMVPQRYMAPKDITVDKTVEVPMSRNVKVNWVRPGTVIHESQQILEYERPRLIPGRFRGVTATEPAPRGMEWGQMYPISDEQARYLQTQGTMSREYANNYERQSDFQDGPDYGYAEDPAYDSRGGGYGSGMGPVDGGSTGPNQPYP